MYILAGKLFLKSILFIRSLLKPNIHRKFFYNRQALDDFIHTEIGNAKTTLKMVLIRANNCVNGAPRQAPVLPTKLRVALGNRIGNIDIALIKQDCNNDKKAKQDLINAGIVGANAVFQYGIDVLKNIDTKRIKIYEYDIYPTTTYYLIDDKIIVIFHQFYKKTEDCYIIHKKSLEFAKFEFQMQAYFK